MQSADTNTEATLGNESLHEDQAAAWNAMHRVGTPVRYWPGFRDGAGREGRTRSEAFMAGQRDPEAAVFVEGYAGWVALSHVEAVPA